MNNWGIYFSLEPTAEEVTSFAKEVSAAPILDDDERFCISKGTGTVWFEVVRGSKAQHDLSPEERSALEVTLGGSIAAVIILEMASNEESVGLARTVADRALEVWHGVLDSDE